jgi:creatinine amidohydrolase
MHFKNICYHLRAAEVLGFRAAILLTGHYGPNWKDLQTLCGLIQPYLQMRVYGLPDFEANKPGFPGDGAGGDHAGKVETSLLWALQPESVDYSQIPAEPKFPLFAMGPNAREANRGVGERMVADEVAWLGRKKEELLAAYDPGAPSRLRTFDQVEAFWAAEVKPRLKDFESMKNFRPDKAAPPESSRWRENWQVGEWG